MGFWGVRAEGGVSLGDVSESCEAQVLSPLSPVQPSGRQGLGLPHSERGTSGRAWALVGANTAECHLANSSQGHVPLLGVWGMAHPRMLSVAAPHT